MLIKRMRRWELPEKAATPEAVFLNRRQLIAGMAGAATLTPTIARADILDWLGLAREKTEDRLAASEPDPTADLYPVKRNPAYVLERDITPEAVNSTYNNFYEFGSHKTISNAAQALPIRPWEVRIEGMVEEERTVDIDTLIRAMPLEERLYRHRCVEAWSMTIAWSGFPMKALVDYARPLSSAKYVRLETFLNPDVAPGQKASWYPWPYVEGVTMDEATNELAFMVTGAYGKPLAKQFGAPLRLALPWKYGFKSIKSIVKVSFTAERPVSFWEEITPAEYGFWANVNPDVPHPRWSQATERVLGSSERIPTRLYNGYEAEVAGLYEQLKETEGRRLYM